MVRQRDSGWRDRPVVKAMRPECGFSRASEGESGEARELMGPCEP